MKVGFGSIQKFIRFFVYKSVRARAMGIIRMAHIWVPDPAVLPS